MKARDRLARSVSGVLGAPPVAALAGALARRRLRVVDYHDISDERAFEAQIAWLARSYRPVDERAVLAALRGESVLPERAVWVTFDDGHPSVVEAGLEVLRRHGVPATFFVCPGLIEAQEPPWWELVYAADRGGVGAELGGSLLRGRALVRALKAVPDPLRRQAVDELRPVGLAHLSDDQRPLAIEVLDRWVDAGFDVGNHTWDHPCLHQCDSIEQRRQIELAHEWLVRYRPGETPTFAYPNGDHTLEAERVLAEAGYPIALLADHRLADLAASAHGMSRLRLDASDGLGRCRAVVSGVHSAAYAAALRLGLTGPSWAGR